MRVSRVVSTVLSKVVSTVEASIPHHLQLGFVPPSTECQTRAVPYASRPGSPGSCPADPSRPSSDSPGSNVPPASDTGGPSSGLVLSCSWSSFQVFCDSSVIATSFRQGDPHPRVRQTLLAPAGAEHLLDRFLVVFLGLAPLAAQDLQVPGLEDLERVPHPDGRGDHDDAVGGVDEGV